MEDFTRQVPLGRTGLSVSRLGIGSSFGAPSRVIEEAFDRGVNYLYWGSVRRPAFGRAMHNLARRHRDEIVLTVQSYSRVPALVGPSVELALRRAGLELLDCRTEACLFASGAYRYGVRAIARLPDPDAPRSRLEPPGPDEARRLPRSGHLARASWAAANPRVLLNPVRSLRRRLAAT